jgi:2-oxoglutarate dehydrogenase E2 component (dihydrolipoamide succinyltransferase)
MPVEVRIPTLGESVTEGVIVRWIKTEGDRVKMDEPLFELETDKASVEIPATGDGVLRILRPEGETVQVGDVVARIEEGAAESRVTSAPAASPVPAAPAPATAAPTTQREPSAAAALSPAVRRLLEEHGLDAAAIPASGRGGRLTKGDVLAHLDAAGAAPEARPAAPSPPATESAGARPHLAVAPRPTSQGRTPPAASPVPTVAERGSETGGRFAAGAERGPADAERGPADAERGPADAERGPADAERVPMTRLRQRIAERLVQAQHTAAILTTFNEIDMQAVMDLRARPKARFSEVHGVSLGFVSFFARACIASVRDVPVVNAQIDGSDVVFHRRVHLGVAVSTERGLVVPVIHNADVLSFAALEKEIERLAALARQNKLGIDDLSGGTFTISNGGVFGSLLSTPILNPPQSAILGMHKIERRPVVVNDAIVVRPMMYVALSYDHRLIDGQQAVTFLVRVKERLEDPTRLMLDL